MNCPHENVVSYSFTQRDYADFSQRLENYIKSRVPSLSLHSDPKLSFLTPNVRGANRTKSMRSTTKTSAPSSEDKLSGAGSMNFLNQNSLTGSALLKRRNQLHKTRNNKTKIYEQSQPNLTNHNQNNANEDKSGSCSKTAETGRKHEVASLERDTISSQRKRAANALLMQTRQLIPAGFANCLACGAIIFKVRFTANIPDLLSSSFQVAKEWASLVRFEPYMLLMDGWFLATNQSLYPDM